MRSKSIDKPSLLKVSLHAIQMLIWVCGFWGNSPNERMGYMSNLPAGNQGQKKSSSIGRYGCVR